MCLILSYPFFFCLVFCYYLNLAQYEINVWAGQKRNKVYNNMVLYGFVQFFRRSEVQSTSANVFGAKQGL